MLAPKEKYHTDMVGTDRAEGVQRVQVERKAKRSGEKVDLIFKRFFSKFIS